MDKALGQIPYSKLIVVIHTYRKFKNNDVIRIISARKATKREANTYYTKGGRSSLKKKYDFSKAVQGKFTLSPSDMEIPIYLNKDIQQELSRIAQTRHVNLSEIVNNILDKELEIHRSLS